MSVAEQPATTQRRYSVIVTYDDESGTYLADVPALGLMTYGFSMDHAFEMAEEAISLRVEAALEDGEPLPVEDHPAQVRQVVV